MKVLSLDEYQHASKNGSAYNGRAPGGSENGQNFVGVDDQILETFSICHLEVP